MAGHVSSPGGALAFLRGPASAQRPWPHADRRRRCAGQARELLWFTVSPTLLPSSTSLSLGTEPGDIPISVWFLSSKRPVGGRAGHSLPEEWSRV